jgi:hypothetical protein
MSFIQSPSKARDHAVATPRPQAQGLGMNGYELQSALEFLAPESSPEQLACRLVIELHNAKQEFRCMESGLYARHERHPHDIAIFLVDHQPVESLPTQGLAPFDEDDVDAEPFQGPQLVLNGYQLQNALEFLAPDGTPDQLEQTLVIEPHDQDADFPETGLYAYHDECPEEGAILLLDHEVATSGTPASA